MKNRTLILGAIALAVMSAPVVRFMIGRYAAHQIAIEVAFEHDRGRTSATSGVIQPRHAATAREVPLASDSNSVLKELSVTNNKSSSNAIDQKTASVLSKESLRDPVAREALTFVGLDPEAEDYWLMAINDLSLPANERQDLIEDLNEEGLPDPEHPTVDDLPLILNRLAIIEAIGPDAADKVNADAFLEAYKDLLNLAELAMGGGEAVR